MKKLQYFVLSICSIVILGGCSSKETMLLINDYAKTSKTTQSDILSLYKDVVFQEQQSIYYRALRDGASINQLFANKIEHSGQIEALEDLVQFTEALARISSDEIHQDLDANALKLYNSANKLSKNEYVISNSEISTQEVELFTTIVNASSKGYLEYKKTQKIKELILVSDKWVQSTLGSLEQDLESWKNHLKKSLNSRKNIQLLVLNDPYKYCKIQSVDRRCHILNESFKSKVDLYSDVHNIQKRIKNLDMEFDALSNSIKLLSELHQAIIDSIKRDRLDDISRNTIKRNLYRLKELSESVQNYRDLTKG
jgi:hypothetical protein